MNKSPRISVIMIDGNFRERFSSIACFAQLPFSGEHEVIWVDYYKKASPGAATEVDRFPNARLVTCDGEGTYHSSYAFNAGIMAARGEILVIVDADVFVEDDFLEKVAEAHRRNDRLVMYVRRFDQDYSTFKQSQDMEYMRKTCFLKNPINFGGCLTVRKHWLMQINGYDKYVILGSGFHANGKDVNVRFRNLGLDIQWHPSLRLYHPWHPHTVVQADIYQIQAKLILYRELNLITGPIDGIDAVRNTALPRPFLDFLEKEARKIEEAQQNVAGSQL